MVSTHQNARGVVYAHLGEQASRFPDLSLDGIDTTGLDSRDAALVLAIEQAVLRRWLTLSAVLDTCLSQPLDMLEPRLKGVLLGGTAQLLLLDRIPDHAVIDESVEWAKQVIRPGAGKMVNAVLRRVAAMRTGTRPASDPGEPTSCIPLHDGTFIELADRVFDPDPVINLVQSTSHCHPLVESWIASHGYDQAVSFCNHNLLLPPIVAWDLDMDHVDRSNATEHPEAGAMTWTGPASAINEAIKPGSTARIQDAGSATALRQTADSSPGLIIDMCAGKGTKTLQLASMHPGARIIAGDTDRTRMNMLRQRTAGMEQIEVIELDRIDAYKGKADLVLLDVPCSNTGVIPRRSQARYRYSRNRTRKLVKLQQEIIERAIPLLGTGGRLQYVTCSLEPAENQFQAEWISRKTGMTIAKQDSRMPEGLPGDPPTTYRDGGFSALLA